MWGSMEPKGLGRGQMSVALVVVAGVAGGLLGWSRETPTQGGPLQPAIQSARLTLIEVHVAGWVNSPGVVSVAEGAIVADAIDLAGGLRAGARVELINLAAPLRAGDRVVVPGPDESSMGGSSKGGLVVLNRASAADLEALPGVGPVLAERIVAFRDANGPFSTVEDLLQIPGIGEAKLASIRDLVRVP